MTKQKQIEEMVDVMTASNNPFIDIPTEQMPKVAEALYDAGYRKTFISDLASETQKAFKEGYIKGSIDSMLLARKETAKEILKRGKYCMPSGLRDWIKELYSIEVEE